MGVFCLFFTYKIETQVMDKKNYAWLHEYNPKVADACLVDGLTYDAALLRLVKTYPLEGLRRKAECVYFPVDPPPAAIEVSCSE
jgi:hypothetical protein